MYSIEMKNVSKNFEDFGLKNINLNIPKGSIVGLIGENGSGKTSILKLILNLIKKDEGEIKVFGKNSLKDDRNIYENVGSLLDDSYLPNELNVIKIENIMGSLYSNWDSKTFNNLIDRFALPRNKNFKDYSKGMRVKAALAISLSHNANLLILDEPTSGLDPIIRDEILEIFMEYMQNEENSILISSHISSDLEKIADYIAFIDNGELIFFEYKDKLIYDYGLLKCKSNEFDKIEKDDLLVYEKTKNGYKCLVKDKRNSINKYFDFVIDDVGIDDIMLIYKKGIMV